MPTVTQRATARRDLAEHFVYLAGNGGRDVAERFLANAESSFNDLARQPKMGAAVKLRHADLVNVRKWRVKGFDNHVIFYEPRPDGVSILRVLHAGSDWWRLLGLAD